MAKYFFVLLVMSVLMSNCKKPIFENNSFLSMKDNSIYFHTGKYGDNDSFPPFYNFQLEKEKVLDSVNLKDFKLYKQLDFESIINDYFPRFKSREKRKIGYDNQDSIFHHLNYLDTLDSFQKRFSNCKDCNSLNNFFQKYKIKGSDLRNKKRRKWILKLVKKALVLNAFNSSKIYFKGPLIWEIQEKSWKKLVAFYNEDSKPFNFYHRKIQHYNKNFFFKIDKIPVNRCTYLFAVNHGFLLGIINFSVNEKGYLTVERNIFNPEVMLYYNPLRR